MKSIFFSAGVVLSSLAIFSVQLGLDNDAGWGPKRIVLLAAGIACLALGGAVHFFGKAAVNAVEGFNAFIESRLSRGARITAASLASSAIVISAYFWFAQLDQRVVGFEFEYYIEMAKSFKKGHLYLETMPPPELLALENPYDYFLRKEKGVDNFPWDLSLYNEKFYIYWGPAPAALTALFSYDLLNRIGDFHLAFAAACGTFIYQALIIATYWNRELKRAPVWLLGILLLTVGLMTPVPMMLNGAKVYDAAIFSGQLFLMGGCFWAYSAFLDGSPSVWKLSIASGHWALSVGSRVTVLPGALVCAGLTLLFITRYYRGKGIGSLMPAFLGVSIPLLVGGGALAWYNWVRFGSISEFGLTYQLANNNYTSFQNVFSVSRIPTNLGIYLTYPIQFTSRFPYLSPVENINFNERLAGLLYIAPYIILLALPILRVFKYIHPAENKSTGNINAGESSSWLFHALLSSGLVTLTVLFSFYYAAMRYTEDFLPALVTLITIQAAAQYDLLHNIPLFRRGFLLITLILASITVLANTLLATPNDEVRFAVNFLNDIYKLLGFK